MKYMQGLACVLLLVSACKDRSPAVKSPVPGVEGTEAELKRFVSWQHDWKALVRRQREEGAAEQQRLERQIAGGNTQVSERAARDEFNNRQQTKFLEFMKSSPTGPTAQALRVTLSGIGIMVEDARGTTYKPVHNEAQLDRARAYYGNDFVAWVLKHEAAINATLSEDQ